MPRWSWPIPPMTPIIHAKPLPPGGRSPSLQTTRHARSNICSTSISTPFYRRAVIYARQGIKFDRATLGNWSGRACFHLQPVGDHMRRHLAAADRLFMDQTTAPARSWTRRNEGYFWAVASDDRGHGGLLAIASGCKRLGLFVAPESPVVEMQR
jgi:hypothetical protein